MWTRIWVGATQRVSGEEQQLSAPPPRAPARRPAGSRHCLQAGPQQVLSGTRVTRSGTGDTGEQDSHVLALMELMFQMEEVDNSEHRQEII